MKKLLALLLGLLLAGLPGLTEGAGREDVLSDPAATGEPAATAEALELSEWFGGDIAAAAEAIGGMSFSPGEEFPENYTGDRAALRGADGVVTFIELKPGAGDCTLCGVRVGMTRAETLMLMEDRPKLWSFDEEVAWTIRADAADELNNENLVVFFDEDGIVCGAWYRASAV